MFKIYDIKGNENLKAFIKLLGDGYTHFSFEAYDTQFFNKHFTDKDKLDILVMFFNAVFEVKFGKFAPDYVITDLLYMYNVSKQQEQAAYARSSFSRGPNAALKVSDIVQFINNRYQF